MLCIYSNANKEHLFKNCSICFTLADSDQQCNSHRRTLMFLFFAAYLGFVWMLLLVTYGQRDPNAFLLNQHIRKSFSEKISGSMSLGDVFTWANTSLLRNLFGAYPGKYVSALHHYVHKLNCYISLSLSDETWVIHQPLPRSVDLWPVIFEKRAKKSTSSIFKISICFYFARCRKSC